MVATDRVDWSSAREREVSVTTGVRVVPLSGVVPCQVQTLELAPGGGVRVQRVVPGDVRHLALWQALMKGERDWVVAEALQTMDENGGAKNG